MTIVTGTSDFQQLFQGLLAETVIVDGEVYGVPIVKLTGDSVVGGAGGSNPQIVSGSVLSLDFPTYAEWDFFGETIYSGTNLYHGVFRHGGATGTVIATIDMTYDASDNLLTVSRT